MILQRLYNIDHDNTEYIILDYFSFMHYLGLAIHEWDRNKKTFWLFRDRIAMAGLGEFRFKILDRQLSKDGNIMNTEKTVDASFVEVAIQRNFRKENEKIKEREILEDWDENKRLSKDTETR
jgi:IS5 family transposase